MPAQSAPAFPEGCPDLDERKVHRLPVRLPATLKCDKTPDWQVEVADFTQLGCRVAVPQRVSVGTFVTLTIPMFVDLVGWVAWTTDDALGIDFSHPLPSDVLAHVVQLGSGIE
jgi:hypothetical protein